ncbi:MAG: DNA primase DnaG [Acidilobaceae archaeon]
MKYLIKARIEVDGKVEKHDVIGALFGQTEGLLGSEFDLEDLQEKDKIGRVQVDLKFVGSKTVGTIQLPSNLDRVETAIIAAMIETVDRVGPYTARIIVEDIKDLRTEKIKVVIERAKEIIRKIKESEPDIKEVIRRVESEAEKAPKLVEYGSEKLPAGPDVEVSDTIILVEGRADVLNLLRYGYTNVIALEGAKETIPESIKKLSQGKKVILFVDGDRGGELIALNVIGQIKVDYIARAPEGREVENLTGREIAKALSEMATVEEFIKKVKPTEAKPEVKPVTVPEAEAPPVEEQPPEAKPQPQPQQQIVETITVAIPKNIIGEIDKLKGTLEAVLYDQNWNDVSRVKVKDLFNTLQTLEPGKVFAVVFDGIVTQRLLEVASEKNISLLIGARMGTKLSFKPPNVRVLTFSDLT